MRAQTYPGSEPITIDGLAQRNQAGAVSIGADFKAPMAGGSLPNRPAHNGDYS